MNKRCATDDCYASVESGNALFCGPIPEGDDPFWRCYIHHDGPVAAVLVIQPLAALEVTINQGVG